jgi:type II secretory pathway component PulJ
LSAPIIVAQASAVHGDLERGQRAHRKAAQLELELAATTQELEQTQAALDKKSSLLRSANEAIEQLRRDVQAAGAIHRHRADELRSRYKGLLEGELDRHLETIQRAADMTPPRGSVIIERVEILLETLKRELKWLKNSE